MAPTWPAQIYELLKGFDVRQVAYVPDAGHAELIRLCQSDTTMQTVSLTTEEEGVAMLCGAWLGGHHGVLLMQSSGVGNCINMLTLNAECRIPLLMLVTMRGDFGEGNPQQMPMGRGAQAAMEAVGVVVLRADRAEDVAEIGAGRGADGLPLAACRGAADRPARDWRQGDDAGARP